ncbi:hypothetical protein KEM54_003975, partial [Ascosphaera aggregata]
MGSECLSQLANTLRSDYKAATGCECNGGSSYLAVSDVGGKATQLPLTLQKSMVDLSGSADESKDSGDPASWSVILGALLTSKRIQGGDLWQPVAGYTKGVNGKIIGCLARSRAFLNDSAIVGYAALLSAAFSHVEFIDPVLTSAMMTGAWAFGADLGGIAAQNERMRAARVVLAPIHWEDDSHWTLLAYDLAGGKKAILDSMDMNLDYSQ